MTARPRNVQGNVALVDQNGNPINSGNPVPAYSPDVTASGTITGVGQTVGVTLTGGQSEVGFYLSGTFFGTVIFEASEDGVQFSPRVCRTSGVLNNLQTSTSTFPSEWRGVAAGFLTYRIRCTAYTSGTLNAYFRSSTGVGPVFLAAPIPIGAESAGNTWMNQTVAAGATWPASPVYENMTNVADISVDLTFTQISTITLLYSQDGSTIFQTIQYTNWPANTPFILSPTVGRTQYFAIQVQNNGVVSGTLNQEVEYRATGKGEYRVQLGNTSTQLKDASIVSVQKAVLSGRNGTDDYRDAKINTLQILRAAGITGTAGGAAGISGSVNVPSGAVVTGITAESGTVNASVTLPWVTGTITLPGSNQSTTNWFNNPVPGTVVGPYTLTFGSTTMYHVEWVVPD